MIITLLISFTVFASGQEADWSYEGENGPDNWPEMFEQCGGSRQSPINIDCNDVKPSDLNCFDFSDYSKTLDLVKIENSNGKTIKLTPYERIRLSGGSLPDSYTLEEFHFHWGKKNYEGSEHSYENGFNPMELHFVHKNEKYATMQEALQHEDGIAVIAVFFQICYFSSRAMERIRTSIPNVLYANQSANISFGLPLSELLPRENCEYFRYQGSLTTPQCNEVVTWTLLKYPICVTKTQLHAFRNVRQTALGETERFLKRNFRPIQPLNGRTVEVNSNCYY